MTRLVLWRHGQTDYNVAGKVQGRVDIPLNEAGRAQAASAAPGLAALRPTAIVSSPLRRARQTAEALSAVTGVDVRIDHGLVERSFGMWEGLGRARIEEGWPEQFAVWRAGGDPAGVGVETRAAAAARVGAALERIAAAVGEATVVVVAHGAAITLGATRLLGLDPSAWFGLRGLDNCRYAVLSSTARSPGWRLERWNSGEERAGSGTGGAIGGFLS